MCDRYFELESCICHTIGEQMSIFDVIGGVFTPVAKIVDDLSTSDEERLKLRNELAKIEQTTTLKMMDLEKARLEATAKIQVSEANSKHWLQGNWRPMTSLILVGLMVLESFGLIELSIELYDIATIFLGGYVGSRGLEKITTNLKLK